MQENNERDRAILNFTRSLLPQPELLQELQQLSTGHTFIQLLSQVQHTELDRSRVVQSDGWATSLSNLKLLCRSLENYYQEVLKQRFEKEDLDLLKIAKYQDRDEIVKVFRVLLTVMTQATNRELFIAKMMGLEDDEQRQLANMIQTALTGNQQQHLDGMLEEKQALLHKVNELEQQLTALTHENSELKEQKAKLTALLCQQSKRVEYLQQQTSQLKLSNLDAKMQMISVMQKQQTNSLVQNLKEKLISVSIEHEKEIIKYRQEVEMMEHSLNRMVELERVNEDYADAVEEMKGKVNQLAREKDDLIQQLEEKNREIENCNDKEKLLNQRIQQLEYEKVNLRLETEKAALRSNQLKQVITKITTPNESLNKSTRSSKLSELCPELNTETFKTKCDELQQEILIHTRRNKELEKELSKTKIKADKAQKLQQEKRKLEEVLLDYTNSRGEEIEVLTTALYEVRIRYKNLLKKYQQRQNHPTTPVPQKS